LKVKFFATYREFTRCNEADIRVLPDVRTLLLSLGEQYGDAFLDKLMTPDGMDIGCDTIVLVNGRNVHHMDGAATTLSDTDIVSIFPMVAGG
jgi:molybdopterin synthase sulfur carrier subunit